MRKLKISKDKIYRIYKKFLPLHTKQQYYNKYEERSRITGAVLLITFYCLYVGVMIYFFFNTIF